MWTINFALLFRRRLTDCWLYLKEFANILRNRIQHFGSCAALFLRTVPLPNHDAQKPVLVASNALWKSLNAELMSVCHDHDAVGHRYSRNKTGYNPKVTDCQPDGSFVQDQGQCVSQWSHVIQCSYALLTVGFGILRPFIATHHHLHQPVGQAQQPPTQQAEQTPQAQCSPRQASITIPEVVDVLRPTIRVCLQYPVPPLVCHYMETSLTDLGAHSAARYFIEAAICHEAVESTQLLMMNDDEFDECSPEPTNTTTATAIE